MAHYVIVGNGAAGVSAAEVIRRRDPDGRITIISDEPYRLYSRPGIAYLVLEQIDEEQIIARGESFYRDHRFELRVGHATALDLARRSVTLDGGGRLAYDVLLLATGAKAAPPAFPGGDLEGVLSFDSLDDARRVVRLGKRARASVVVGGGITAMELAEGLRHQGGRVYWLQRQERIWPRLFNERESEIVAEQVQHHGIEVLYKEEIVEALGKRGKVAGVRLKSGRELACEIVGVAIGVKPNLELAAGLGLAAGEGLRVDDFMQTSAPGVFAAGDVSETPDAQTGRYQLDVLWPSAINEGRVAGFNMVEVARGRAPSFAYRKGYPFNAAKLFGLHLTVIGRIGDSGRGRETPEEAAYHSRGSSNTWTTPFGPPLRSAWDSHGPNALRVAVSGGRIVGALLLGDQKLADPLRELVEGEVALAPEEEAALAGAAGATPLPETVRRVWERARQA
jgi:NAD(P)H-nitrite reductase large subunit